MGYIRITIKLYEGKSRSGIRHFAEPMNFAEIKQHAWQLAAEALGRGKIANVILEEVPADHPEVVALIMRGEDKRSRKRDYS